MYFSILVMTATLLVQLICSFKTYLLAKNFLFKVGTAWAVEEMIALMSGGVQSSGPPSTTASPISVHVLALLSQFRWVILWKEHFSRLMIWPP